MAKIGVWSIEENGPVRIEETAIDFERDLEDWIEADPALLQAGLTIVGRQFPVEGGRIDLLAIDPQGRWTVIEIKRNALARDAVAQAIDYGACIAGESDEDIERKANEYLSRRGVTLQKVLSDVAENEDGDGVGREIQLFIVGTGSQRGLERMMKFLSERHGVPITAFTFDAFRGPSGRRLLVRAFAEAEIVPRTNPSRPAYTFEELSMTAEQGGIGTSFRLLYDAAIRHDLYPRTYKHSIMYTHPEHKHRMLYTTWNSPVGGKLDLWVASSTFAEYYDIPEQQAVATLGPNGRRRLDESGVRELARQIDAFFVLLEGDAGDRHHSPKTSTAKNRHTTSRHSKTIPHAGASS